MLNQFSRTQLLIGKEAMDRLSKTRVAIFGIGGVGGYTAEALARSGVGELDLIDDDKVCLTNINRQIFATRKTVGKYKVDVAEERLKDINPDIIINKHQTFYTPETSEKFDFSKYDYVVDAIDTVTGKIELVMQADKAKTPIICSMGAGRFRIFRKIILPEILPSVLTGFGLAFGRCLGEYGSVVFIAGNKPFETEITPLIIMSELQEYDYKSATAIALVMLAASFLILFLVNMVQHRNAKILKGGR